MANPTSNPEALEHSIASRPCALMDSSAVDDTDVARLRQAVASLREDNRGLSERIKQTYEIANLLMWECDGATITWHATPETVFDFFGRVPASYIEVLNIVHPDDVEAVREVYGNERVTDSRFSVDYRFVVAGAVRYVREIGVPLHREGRLVGHRGTIQDITERRLAEQKAAAVIEELGRRNAELDQFTYTVSHDLRSPLISIRGFLGLLRKDLEEHDQSRALQDMAVIEQATAWMGRILDELLNLSRVGRFAGPTERLSLRDLVMQALSVNAGVLDAEFVSVPAELPFVFGNRDRLVELIQNLLHNAAKFRNDSDPPSIGISAVMLPGEVHCRVTDNGIGIATKHQEQVFDLFRTLGESASGSGVGLALCKRIVEYHGGRIWVESAGTGQGSSFHFTLPRSE